MKRILFSQDFCSFLLFGLGFLISCFCFNLCDYSLLQEAAEWVTLSLEHSKVYATFCFAGSCLATCVMSLCGVIVDIIQLFRKSPENTGDK